jgi:hypothetical protein
LSDERKDEHKNERKIAVLLGSIAAVGLYTYVWITSDEKLHSSLLSGGVTLISAIVGLYIVSYQLRRQGENTADSNQQSEKLKLKKDIYLDVLETSDEASTALGALYRYTLKGVGELREHRVIEENKGDHGQPQFSVKKLARRYEAVSQAMLKLSDLTEKWKIVDPRISIFQKAFAVQNEFLRGAFATFLTGCYRYFRSFDASGKWPFQNFFVADYEARLTMLTNEITCMQAYIYDFRVAMQNALLGELFKEKLPMRKPVDPNIVVIDLDKCEEVEARLEEVKKSGKTFDTEAGLASLTTPSWN